MASVNWVNNGPANGLLPDGTKPLPESMLTSHHQGPVAITWGDTYSSITKISFKITSQKFHPNLLGSNVSVYFRWWVPCSVWSNITIIYLNLNTHSTGNVIISSNKYSRMECMWQCLITQGIGYGALMWLSVQEKIIVSNAHRSVRTSPDNFLQFFL